MMVWDDADRHAMRGPVEAFSDTVPGEPDGPTPTIGHIGRYALKYQRGEGGIGTVYAAHDPLLSRLIAVKTLHVEVEESEREAFNALFLNEARAAGGLSHPHIVTVFDAGISDDRAYIAMELLKGRDLRQLRQDGWRATPAQAALIVRRVADALGYAHSKGVIHRDVKPANIFMIGRTQPKVLDFGIARIAHGHDASQRGDDIAAGSPYYMAPEQVRRETVDRRADVFSLGVVLYELLTQLKPFRGATLDEITTAVLEHDPPAAHAVDASVPAALGAIAAKALAKNPEHRYRSARAFSRELRHWLDENSVGAEGDPPPGDARRSPRWQIAAATFGAAIALGGVAWAMLASSHAAPRAAAAEPELAQPQAATLPLDAAGPGIGTLAAPPAAPTLAAAAASDTSGAASSTAPVPWPSVATEGAKSVAMPDARPTSTPARARSAAGDRESRESPKDRRMREARERETRPAAALATAVPTALGLLRIAVSPWGEVEVDGKPAGTAPPLNELRLAPGRHQVVVRNADLPPYSTVVNVTADQPVTLKHRF